MLVYVGTILRTRIQMFGWHRCAIVSAAFLVSMTAFGGAAPVIAVRELSIDYTVIDNYPGADRTTVSGLNAAGDISGTAYVDGFSGTVGFLWHKATNTFTTIDLGIFGLTSGFGLNDAGLVVGEFITDPFDRTDVPSSINLFNGFVFDSSSGTSCHRSHIQAARHYECRRYRGRGTATSKTARAWPFAIGRGRLKRFRVSERRSQLPNQLILQVT